MSLTSYRAAPPRARVIEGSCVRGCVWLALCGSGGDRLSRALRHSTMGAGAFNGRVRDGIGFWARRSSHQTGATQASRPGVSQVGAFGKQLCFWSSLRPCRVIEATCSGCRSHTDTDHESDQANRAISTGQLNASPRLHIQPINVVVFHGSQGSSRFEVGFPLRCLQRLSRPYVAMLHCGWRHNSSTRGTFIPVLSY